MFAANEKRKNNNYKLITDSVQSIDGNQSTSNSIDSLTIVANQAILEGDSQQMLLDGYDVSDYLGKVEWSSSNPDVISCTKSGEITGIKKEKL